MKNKLPLVGIQLTRPIIHESADRSIFHPATQKCVEWKIHTLNIVALFGLGSFLDSIEHDFLGSNSL